MTLLIKQGRCYLRRDGKIEGPMPEPEWDAHKVAHAFKGPQSGMWYLPDGTVAGFSGHPEDLFTELEEASEAGIIAGEAYQVIGDLALAANLYDHPEVQRALDWFSDFEPGVTYKDDASILPWPKEELKADDGWFPIESAPRDGTTILVARDMGTWGWVLGYSRWDGAKGIYGWISNGFSKITGTLGLGNPTHWMPLPEPPRSALAKKEG